MKNERICITPDAPEGFKVFGTLKTVLGVKIIEMHSGFYQTPDLRFCVRRLADEHYNAPSRGRWIVEDEQERSVSDLISTKRDAFEALRETQEYAAAQDAAREAERAAIRASRR